MHLILHWLASLTWQTKGSKFLRVAWRKGRNRHHYIWEMKTNMSVQEWPSHRKFDTNSDQKCWNLKASDLSTGKMLVSWGIGFIKQGFLLACLVHFCWWAFLGWCSPLSLKHQAQWIPDFNWSLWDDTMKTGWIRVSVLSVQPRSYSDLCLWLLQARDDYALEPATPGTSDSRDSRHLWIETAFLEGVF